MTDFKYARQINGIGLYAFCRINSFLTNEATSFVTDKCSWERVKKSYDNAIIHSGLLEWKQSALGGMQCAISHISFDRNREFQLLDVEGLVAATNSTTMFIAGFLSVFEELQVKISQQDLESLDSLTDSPGTRDFLKTVSVGPIQWGAYQFP